MAEVGYIFDPIESDADALQQAAYDYIQVRWPDWVPNEGNLETWMIAACARMVSEAATVASDVPPAILRYLGESVMGVPPIQPTSAEVASTWTVLTNPAGRDILAGTLVGIEDAEANVIFFEVVNTVSLLPSDLSTDAGQVLLRARDQGSAENNLGGAAVEAINMESLAWVDTITLTGATAGGSDGETTDDYLDRLSARLTLLTPRPILPEDYELLTKDIARVAGQTVRVLSVDGYNTVDSTFDNERMITLSVIDDATGDDISGTLEDDIADQLEALRELNFVVHVVGANRTTVDVTCVFVRKSGAAAATANAAVTAALNSFFSSANWGDDPDTNGREWNRVTSVRHQDVSTVVNNVPEVDYWTTLTIGFGGGAQTAADHALTGVAPLTVPGVMTVSS